MQVQVDGGAWTAPHRLDPASAPKGLFVGGLVEDAPQLDDLLTGRGRQAITAIRLISAAPGDFATPFAVTLDTACAG